MAVLKPGDPAVDREVAALNAKVAAASNQQNWLVAQHLAISNALLARALVALSLPQDEAEIRTLSEYACKAATIHLQQYGYDVKLKRVAEKPSE